MSLHYVLTLSLDVMVHNTTTAAFGRKKEIGEKTLGLQGSTSLSSWRPSLGDMKCVYAHTCIIVYYFAF